MKYTREVIAQDQAVAAGSVNTWDLPVNPLSHLVFTIKGINVAAAEATLAQILATVPRIEVLYKGGSLFSMSAADLWALDAALFGKIPILTNQVATINATRALTLVIPFGKTLYNPDEALPATSRGELKLQATIIAAFAGLSGAILQIEAISMPETKPKQFLKSTTVAITPVAGVENDVALPIGNKYAGLLLFSTTVPTGIVWTTTVHQVRLMLNGLENYFSRANWESLHGDFLNRIGQVEQYDLSVDNDDLMLYALMDLIPQNTDTFVLDSKGMSSLVLKITAGDANPVRVIPLELVTV